MQTQNLILLIDSIAPINNAIRREHDPIRKVELVWELGLHLDSYIRNNKSTLDELLYSIYDPHATVKRSNITRSLGSYSFRVFHYFKKQKDIHQILHNLKSYNIFIEALPLLTNKKYTPYVEDEYVLSLVNSNHPVSEIVDRLNSIKRSIMPTREIRISPMVMYAKEKRLFDSLIVYMENIFRTKNSLSELNNVEYGLGDSEYREQFVSILMALASDAFRDKVELYNEPIIKHDLKSIYRIAISNNENRARFRKWVLSSNKLLWLAEAIHAFNNEDGFRYFKKKIEK